MPTKTAKDYKNDYTKPELREHLKEEIKKGSKGGKSGQWSARKSQLLVKEYEKQGGSYKHSGKKTTTQKNLTQWTEEDWQTADNKVAIRDDKTVRYLPKKVWQQLSKNEQQATNDLKVAGSKRGKQTVANPKKVKTILQAEHKKHHK